MPVPTGSGATGRLADNPNDPSLAPVAFNPADYAPAITPAEAAVAPTMSAAEAAQVPFISPEEAAIAPALTGAPQQMTRAPVQIFGEHTAQDLIPGRTFDSPANQSAPAPAPSTLDLWDAALSQNNVVTSLYDRLRDGTSTPKPVPGYDPLTDVSGYEDLARRFINSRSPEETQQIKNRINEERINNDIIARSGWGGVAASMAAGTVDPISLALMAIPVAPELGMASRAARVTAGVGTGVALQTAQEAVLHATQETRTVRDSLINVSAGALLTGILGHIATRVPPAELEAARVDLGVQIHGAPPPGQSTAGAMRAGTTLKQESIARGGQTLAKTVGQISPATRQMQAPVVEARHLTQDLVDTAGYLNKNFEGIATPTSVESMVKQQINIRSLATIEDLDNAYLQYRQRAGAEAALSKVGFGEEVLNAMSQGGAHDVPEVAALARNTAKVFDADRKALQDLGMLGEETEVVGAKGYVPRVYDQPAIAANRIELEQRLQQWYTDHPSGEKELELARQETRKAAEEVVRLHAEHQNGMVDFYHGSHAPVTEFSDLHIGTGEGNQSFGIGHYAAEAPGTALSYVPQTGGHFMHGRTSQRVIDAMLDFNKPLKQQPKVLEALGVDPNAPVKLNGVNPEWTGQELHDAISNGKTNLGIATGKTLQENKQLFAKFFQEKGITGIKYLDQLSRKATGKKTRNFVFFNPKDAEVLSHERIGHLGERVGTGLPERFAAHAEATATAKATSKEALAAAKTAYSEAKTAERQAQKVTELGRAPEEIRSRVLATLDHMQGTAHGNADIGGPKKPNVLKARALDAPDELLKPWLIRNYEDVMRGYHRTLIPQIEMTRKFGSITLTNEIQQVTDAYHILQTGAKTNAAKEALRKQQAASIEDLQALRDRVLGQTQGAGWEPRGLVRALAVFRAYNYVRLLGSQTLSSLSDAGRLVAHYGLARTSVATAKFLTNVTANKLIRSDAKAMGTAVEWVLDSRAKTIGEIGDSVAGTKLEKLTQSGTHAFTRLTLMATWNSSLKAIGAALEQHAIFNALTKDTVSAIDRAKLASHGIGDAELVRIKDQFLKYGTNEQGLHRARTSLWDDQGAAQLVEQAVIKAADITAALNVGKGDLPLLMNSALARTLLQFKSFGMASVNRLMIPVAQGLAHGDVAAANGLVLMMGLGALTYWTKEWTAGRVVDMTPRRVTMEALNWSGVLGFLPDAYDPIGNTLHLPRFSKYADRSISETLAGPTAGSIDTLLRTTSGLVPRGPWSPGPEPKQTGLTSSDVHRVRQLLPGQNLFYLRRLVNAVEGETAESLGVEDATSQSFGERVVTTQPPK